jgi:predicted transcriptional regulator
MAKHGFNPLEETIIDYLLRRCNDYPNKSDLVRATGVSHANISKMINTDSSPRLVTIQPLFKFFIEEDLKASRRRKTATTEGAKSVH